MAIRRLWVQLELPDLQPRYSRKSRWLGWSSWGSGPAQGPDEFGSAPPHPSPPTLWQRPRRAWSDSTGDVGSMRSPRRAWIKGTARASPSPNLDRCSTHTC